jgi:hypothetical protein
MLVSPRCFTSEYLAELRFPISLNGHPSRSVLRKDLEGSWGGEPNSVLISGVARKEQIADAPTTDGISG